MGMLKTRHLLTIDDLSAQEIQLVLDTTRSFKEVNERVIKKLPTLRGRTIINLFLEPSTRTRTSFEIAAKRLSADAVNMSGSASATVKGESLVDTAKTLDAMDADLVIIRHAMAGSPQILANTMRASIINGGDGKHQHPTQALLDLYTIREHFGSFENLRVGIVGDVAHSRVAGSLLPALGLLGAQTCIIAPPTLLPACPEVWGAEVSSTFEEMLPTLDVVYMLRVQQERMERAPLPSLREYAMLFGLNLSRLHLMKKEAIIMHPGPINRGVELSSEAADAANNLLLYQVNAGVAVRMALMYLLLGGESDGVAA